MADSYLVEYRQSLKKDLRKIDSENRAVIVTKIQALARNPRPTGVTKLRGSGNLYRIRSGDFRIIYEIFDKKLVIIIIKVGHRSHIYD